MDVEDPDAPKLASSLRKPDPFDPAGGSRPSSRAANRHITFGTDGDGNVFDDTADGKKVFPKETKVFPKETKKGLKTGPDAKVRLRPWETGHQRFPAPALHLRGRGGNAARAQPRWASLPSFRPVLSVPNPFLYTLTFNPTFYTLSGSAVPP